MKPSEVANRLSILFRYREPVLLTGPPGVGKSDLVRQACEAGGMNLIVSHPVVSDPTDYKGLPGIVDGKAEFLAFGDLRALVEATSPTVCLLDDLGQAAAVVQAAAMQLLLARRVNGHAVGDVAFCAASNRRQDRAGVTGILEPVKSRFATILEVSPDLEDWSRWAIAHNVAPEVVAFLRFRPALLSDFTPTADLTNSPCPRTWASAGRLVSYGLTDVETLSGCIGQGAAIELVAFLRVWRRLPSIDGILLNPDTAPVPSADDAGTLYAVTGALAHKASLQTAGRIIRYAGRLPAEFSVLCVRDAHRRCPDIAQTPEFIRWAADHSDVLL